MASAATLSLGSWITAPHPSVVELMAGFDFDWLTIDLEHTPIDPLAMQVAVSTIQARGKKAFVRVAEMSHTAAKFPLDAGADGIIFPMVNSAQQAKAAVDHCFYPPRGDRGVGLGRAHDFGFAFERHLEQNKDVQVIVQVEHVAAVEQISEILRVDGLAGVFVGPYDLSGSMGLAGQFDHPKMKEAMTEVAEKTRSAGKLLGAHVIAPDYREIQRHQEQGFNFLALSTDVLLLGHKINDQLMALGREGIR